MGVEIVKYETLKDMGFKVSKEEYKKLLKKHSYIGEKMILDLVNGVGVVAKDLNDSAKEKEKGIARVWDAVSGSAKKREDQINENFIYGLEAASKWLQDHDRHISRMDVRIKDVADALYNTQGEILKFYKQFKDVDHSVEVLENFKKNAQNRFNEIKKRLENIEAQQQIDREVAKVGTLMLPKEVEIFTVLDNLSSGKFGIWYALSENQTKKNEQLQYLKNKLKEKIGMQRVKDFIDFYKIQRNVKKLETIEQKSLAFISSQYRQFNDDKLYDSIDIIKLTTTVKDREELEKHIEKNAHIRTFMTMENFIDDTTDYVLSY